jgi:hypothetical protein
MISTTAVLIAVAKFESTPSIPTLARIDVNAAKMDERIAKTNHIYISPKSISIVDIYDGFINDKKIITIYINPYGIVTSKKLPQEPSLTRKVNN